MSELPPDLPARIVKPRRRKPTIHRNVLALSKSEVMTEAGEVYSAEALPTLLKSEPSSILAVQGFGLHLQRLQRMLGPDPDEYHDEWCQCDRCRFNFRVTPQYRVNMNGHQSVVHDCVTNFVGWSKVPSPNRKPALYHYPLDPVHFIRLGIDELKPGDKPRLVKLMEWAQEVRDWCHRHELVVKPSSGGLVAQLLRDPSFYPTPRRKSPRLINDTARSRLPGNYYHLRVPTGEIHKAIYLDISSAHHTVAQRLRFPDVNTLRAYGRWSDKTPSRERKAYAGPDYPGLTRPGLFRLRLMVPHIEANKFPPPWAQTPGPVEVWLFSNELETLTELRIPIDSVVAAYVSEETEPGLNRYAKWCLEQLRAYPEYKPWLKPTLHSTYGILAARPTPFETGYYRAKGGDRVSYPMGPVDIQVLVKSSKRPIESGLLNVIHRGMIEAEVRKEALWMARFLTEVDKRDVLSVYADSLFIRDSGRPLRLLPPWWRISEHVTDLRFMSATHFSSREIVRLPGFARHRSNREQAARAAILGEPSLPSRFPHPSRRVLA